MQVRVSRYGRHYSHRAGLMGYGMGADEEVQPMASASIIPSPGAVFGTIAGVSLAVPIAVALGHRMLVRGSTWKRAAGAGLMAAGVLYIFGALGTAGVAAGVASAVQGEV